MRVSARGCKLQRTLQGQEHLAARMAAAFGGLRCAPLTPITVSLDSYITNLKANTKTTKNARGPVLKVVFLALPQVWLLFLALC